MSEQDSFLARIFADYYDNTPRLVLADWLEERGDLVRAIYIRYHCGFYDGDDVPPQDTDIHTPNSEWMPVIPGHTRRERTGVVEYLGETGAPFARCKFHRGFCQTLIAPAWWVAENWHILVGKHPISSVRLGLPNPRRSAAGDELSLPRRRADAGVLSIDPAGESDEWTLCLDGTSIEHPGDFAAMHDRIGWAADRINRGLPVPPEANG